MASIYYYLSVFPTEALIASQLEPEQFATYMATGSRKGSAEKIIFIQITEEFGSYFDWDYAHEKCVPHANGDPKHSVYLSVYRTLEHVELDKLGPMYLTTRDGRSLRLDRSEYSAPEKRNFYLYQELCPINPLVVSSLDPSGFADYICNPAHKVSVPKILFADLKVIDFEHPEQTGNIGGMYDRNVEHLKECIHSVTEVKNKANKTLERSHIESFSYQIIGHGLYVSDGKAHVTYPMKGYDELNRDYRAWARSAQIM